MMFEDIIDRLQGVFSDWVEHRDDKTQYTIEDFDYSTGVIAKVVYPHCDMCVAVNKCYFKNEIDKKPQEKLHYNCHCIQTPIDKPNPDDVKVIMPEGKISYLFERKLGWIKAMGYTEEDRDEVEDLIKTLSYREYCLGNYENILHNNYGYKINVYIDFPGKAEKLGRTYKIKSCYMIFPNGQIKCNTPIGGWQK